MMNKEFEQNAYLSGESAGYVEALYEAYLKNPDDVNDRWKNYFSSFGSGDISHENIRDALKRESMNGVSKKTLSPSLSLSPQKQSSVDALITAYRRYGHLNAKIDPLGNPGKDDVRLKLSNHGLSDADLNETFDARKLFSNKPTATLKEIVDSLQHFYCGSTGFEYTRLINEDEREWLRDYIENKIPTISFSPDAKKQILRKLTEAEGLEKYLDTKYPGQKRFSIEGGDTLIPMLDVLTNDARAHNVREMMIGMAHRGRLNVLINIMGKPPEDLFHEFDGTKDYGSVTGDVKYHKGYSSDVGTESGPIHLSLGFNPSHLEFINTVVMGS